MLQSLTYNMAKNNWHRYDMKKLRHCHPMFTNVRVSLLILVFSKRLLRLIDKHINREANKLTEAKHNLAGIFVWTDRISAPLHAR